MPASTILKYVLAVSMLVGLAAPAQAEPQKLLKGNLSETGRTNPGTGLTRQDVQNKGDRDSFSGTDEDGEMLQPTNTYKASAVKPVIQHTAKPIPGNIQEQGSPNYGAGRGNMAPQDMGGDQDAMPAQVQQPQPPMQPAFNPNDPDQSPDMQLAWDQWHKRVAQCIFERFNFFAKAAFRHSPPIMAKLTYTVTNDGRILNVNMAQKSTNMLFNVLVTQSVQSLNGDMSILAFPPGSRRMWVPKSGIFTQNYGNQAGFRYQVGDQETVRQGGRR